MKILLRICLILMVLLPIQNLIGQKTSTPFAFQFEGKTLHGLIEQPQDQAPKALVILIPGYGRTNFVKGNWYASLRDTLVAAGLSVCCWDKMGCGKSEGVFDAQQPVQNSADEAIAAITELKRLGVKGSEKIGLWGISRAGWICPLINEQYPVDFWISVSGTDDKENFGYLLYSNLIIAGKSEEEARVLFDSWKKGHQLFSNHAPYEQYLDAVQPLMEDSHCQQLFGYSQVEEITEAGRQSYRQQQETFTTDGHFDTESGLWVYIDNLEYLLSNINCPVLALFGAQDSQVDWRKTKALYEKTIAKNPQAALTVKVFDNCNHNLQKCETCAYGEDLSAFHWQACERYYKTMIEWLHNQQIID